MTYPCVACGKHAFNVPDVLCFWCRRCSVPERRRQAFVRLGVMKTKARYRSPEEKLDEFERERRRLAKKRKRKRKT